MKVACLLLLTLTLFFIYSDATIEAGRITCPPYPKSICTLQYSPLCSSDGRTYSNSCFFCKAYIKSSRRLRLKHYGRCRRYGDAQD
ncbi:ovomucoid-like [Sceloporus undulatus]|uniref:ovomucoid-like n=1 Tax=Sceloporus undulatus TaxID=8520 RepID=UPI001C4DD707|nr:ovomucoid-like [Sceloporus undulatus]